LEALAYQLLDLAQGLPLYSLGRQQKRKAENLCEFDGYHDLGRLLAWGLMDLCLVGNLPWDFALPSAIHPGKVKSMDALKERRRNGWVGGPCCDHVPFDLPGMADL
jgi:hypothetical protein